MILTFTDYEVTAYRLRAQHGLCYMKWGFNSLPIDKILDWTKLKAWQTTNEI